MATSGQVETDRWKGYWKTKVSKVGDHQILIRGYPLADIIGSLTFTQAIFLTLRGELPSEREHKMLDALLCAILDHEFICSTAPASRFVASANPQIMPAIAAGVLAMGSNTVSPQDSAELIEKAYALKQQEQLTLAETARRIVDERMAQKKRFPGFGHPTHKLHDPRSTKLRQVAAELGYIGEKTLLYEAIHSELVSRVKKELPINVDGRMACCMSEMGFHPLQMASVGALSFLPGVIAQAIEEIQEGVPLRIIPDLITEYVGEPERKLPVVQDRES